MVESKNLLKIKSIDLTSGQIIIPVEGKMEPANLGSHDLDRV